MLDAATCRHDAKARTTRSDGRTAGFASVGAAPPGATDVERARVDGVKTASRLEFRAKR